MLLCLFSCGDRHCVYWLQLVQLYILHSWAFLQLVWRKYQCQHLYYHKKQFFEVLNLISRREPLPESGVSNNSSSSLGTNNRHFNYQVYNKLSRIYKMATGWTVRGSIPSRDENFRTRPDWTCGPPSLLYNGYRVSFPGVERQGRGADHPPHLSPRLKKEQSYASTPLWAFMACSSGIKKMKELVYPMFPDFRKSTVFGKFPGFFW